MSTIRSAALVVTATLASLAPLTACTSAAEEDAAGVEADDAVSAEADLTQAELARREGICSQIQPGRPWTAEEATRLRTLVLEHIVATKRDNDRLIRERGVGSFTGVKTELAKKIAAGDRAGAAAILRPRLRSGDADRIVADMTTANTTSCVGWVTRAFSAAYTALGRQDEWRSIAACNRAWDSVGTRLQGALARSGWPAPGMAVVSDESPSPAWNAENVGLHRGLLASVSRGVYYGAPISTRTTMKNFLPVPGGHTPKDETMLLQLGRSSFFGLATMRAAYHVFALVPASAIPEDPTLASGDPARWLEARRRGEPFVLESHSTRQAWDKTNFEIRPLTEVVAETYGSSAVYSTGTLLFAPESARPSL